jgi:hypothetical protein
MTLLVRSTGMTLQLQPNHLMYPHNFFFGGVFVVSLSQLLHLLLVIQKRIIIPGSPVVREHIHNVIWSATVSGGSATGVVVTYSW